MPTVKRNESFGEIVGPYGYGGWARRRRDADPVFTPPPPARLSRSSSGQDLRGNPFGTIVAPIGTPSTIQPPPPPPVQSTNAAECRAASSRAATALVPCGHVLVGDASRRGRGTRRRAPRLPRARAPRGTLEATGTRRLSRNPREMTSRKRARRADRGQLAGAPSPAPRLEPREGPCPRGSFEEERCASGARASAPRACAPRPSLHGG